MYCGGAIPSLPQESGQPTLNKTSSLSYFTLSLLISLVITVILTAVFHLPIFILGAFLPLFWRRKQPKDFS
jgi:hypothetical protein